MTFRDWLRERDIDSTRAVCVSLGTDGLNPNTCNLLSISMSRLGEEPETVYVRGADAAKVSAYTGLHADTYEQMAVGRARAFELLQPWLAGTPFLVSYNVDKFFTPWIKEHLLELTEFPCLDVANIAKILDCKQGFPAVEEIGALNARVGHASAHLKAGYGVDTLFTRFVPEVVNESIPLVNRIMNLHLLYAFILDKDGG
jgi:hypothetical protein